MRQSQLFTKTIKEAPKDEKSVNARLLIRAGFVNKEMAGVYTFSPLGLNVLRKIENIVRQEMDRAGGQEILMPSLHPKNNWQKTNRWDNFDALMKIKSSISQAEYALGPTHEEIVVPLLKKFIFSYKDLPQYVYQIQNKFRDEKRAKSGLLRGREFLMKDLYSFHKDEKDLDKYYEIMKKSYEKIFQRVGLGEKTYFTFASGGTFSKYSHEFQTLTSSGEDIIHICKKCKVAVNDEIIKEQNVCPECAGKDLKREKAVEVGNIFKLQTKFSKPFALTYKDEKGGDKDVIMGTYGIGLGRLMGVIVETFHDEKGIIWPKEVAPFKIHLIPVEPLSKIEKTAGKLYQDLRKQCAEVLYDDREGKTPGEKFAEADLIGIPLRVVLSKKTLAKDCVEIKKRGDKKTKLLKIKNVKQGL